MDGIDRLIFEREISALKVAIAFRLLIWGYTAAVEPFQAKSLLEIVLMELLILCCITISVISLIYFGRRLHVRSFGIVGSVLDVIIVTILPVIWYISVGGASVNPAYMLKGPEYWMFLWLILGYNSFAIQPVYILIVLIGGSLGYLGHFLYLALSGKANFTADYVAHNLGSGININFTLNPMLSFLAIGIGLVIFSIRMKKTIYSAVRNEKVSNQLGRYFSPKVRDEIISLKEEVVSEKGKLQNIAVMFSDIRSFTKYCEDKSPQEVVAFLREYQSIMVEIIFKYNGTLDKFIGDGIMATFGTPTMSPDDADNAINAAKEMSSALNRYNMGRIQAGLGEIKIGIGIHYGQAIVGSIGSENRLEYTVIGDVVNIASRLESATKELKREIVFSEELKNRIGPDIMTTLLGSIEIRGHEKPMQVYSI
jgi:adenylate cyclase